ncbi:MAG: hypothetical protein F6J86_46330 [Symploca sp. SIO1B1]|nr:hypothetical protein [Symploca sp. SIO1B1]
MTESEYPRSPNYLEEENQVAIVKAINSFSFGLLNQSFNSPVCTGVLNGGY